MQALRERSTFQGRRWLSPWVLAAAAALLVAAGGIAYGLTHVSRTPVACAGPSCKAGGSGTGGSGAGGSGSGAQNGGHAARHQTFRVTSTTPAPGATGVVPDAELALSFSAAIARHWPDPTLSPAVAGSWRRTSSDTLVFTASAPFVPFQTYTLTLPGGADGLRSASGARLDGGTRTVSFTIESGSVLRLQQLLAELGYLPVSYSPPAPAAPQAMATPQPGTFAWRWSGLPAQLTSQWAPGSYGAITKGAVMMFETENGLSVDGVAGPEVWGALLADAATHKANTEPVTYVLVTKVLPEHLTAWVDGALRFHDIPVNTGVPGANTVDGTFQVFEHVPYSDMKGTDVTGTHYTDPHVPWASYFNGGDALHGFPRASYGWPQSNGCVEMRIATAGALWPYTPIGTVVTVQGPSSGGTAPSSPPPTTTTTTTTTSTTTTTAPPPTTTQPPPAG